MPMLGCATPDSEYNMPLFAFLCPSAHAFRRLLPEATPEVPCPSCGALAARKPRGATSTVYETLDNGLQARATVRIADAERIFKEIEIEADQQHEKVPDEEELEVIDDVGDLV